MTRILRTMVAAILGLGVLLSVAAAPSQADEPVVTRFETTQVFYNTCNDEIVIVNATLATATRLTQVGTRTTYSQRTWLEDVSAASDQQGYTVAQGSIDTFTTTLRQGQTTMRSVQGSWLRLTPTTGETGRLTVVVSYAFTSDLATGEVRVLQDRYSTSCR